MSTAPQVEKLLYSREDAAYALSISLRSIDGMIANQLLHPRRYGRRVLISAAEVKSIAARIERQDILLENGAPVTKLQLVARQKSRTTAAQNEAYDHQETPEEGARRLRTSAR